MFSEIDGRHLIDTFGFRFDFTVVVGVEDGLDVAVRSAVGVRVGVRVTVAAGVRVVATVGVEVAVGVGVGLAVTATVAVGVLGAADGLVDAADDEQPDRAASAQLAIAMMRLMGGFMRGFWQRKVSIPGRLFLKSRSDIHSEGSRPLFPAWPPDGRSDVRHSTGRPSARMTVSHTGRFPAMALSQAWLLRLTNCSVPLDGSSPT